MFVHGGYCINAEKSKTSKSTTVKPERSKQFGLTVTFAKLLPDVK